MVFKNLQYWAIHGELLERKKPKLSERELENIKKELQRK